MESYLTKAKNKTDAELAKQEQINQAVAQVLMQALVEQATQSGPSAPHTRSTQEIQAGPSAKDAWEQYRNQKK